MQTTHDDELIDLLVAQAQRLRRERDFWEEIATYFLTPEPRRETHLGSPQRAAPPVSLPH